MSKAGGVIHLHHILDAVAVFKPKLLCLSQLWRKNTHEKTQNSCVHKANLVV